MLYAIKHKNRVVSGPLAWAQKYFTTVLKVRHRIDATIPGKAPETMPYTVNEDTSIHEVVKNEPELDTMTQAYHGPFWDTSGDVIVANYEVHDLEIASARNNFRAVAAFERYKKEIANTKAEVQGIEVTVDTSRDGRNIFVQKFMLMGDDDTVNWKFPEAWLTLTKAELGLVVQVGADHIQAAFDWEKGINEQIDAAETAEELHAIVIVEKQPNPVEALLEENNDTDQ
jgi:hypothetical protein